MFSQVDWRDELHPGRQATRCRSSNPVCSLGSAITRRRSPRSSLRLQRARRQRAAGGFRNAEETERIARAPKPYNCPALRSVEDIIRGCHCVDLLGSAPPAPSSMPTYGSVVHAGRSGPKTVVSVSIASTPVVSYGCRLRFNATDPATIISAAKTMIASSRAVLDGVAAAATAGKTSWADIMQPLADDETETRADSAALEFYQHVSPHKALRDASTEADKLISEFGVDCEMRVDLYRAVQAFADTEEGKALGGEKARLVERMLRDFKRNGLHLDEAAREQIKKIKGEMSKLSIEFSKNCNDEATKFGEWTLATSRESALHRRVAPPLPARSRLARSLRRISSLESLSECACVSVCAQSSAQSSSRAFPSLTSPASPR